MTKSPFKLSPKLLLLCLGLLLMGIAFTVYPLKEGLKTFNDQVANWGVPGMILFIGVYALSAVLLVPASILTLGAGFAFGLVQGMAVVSISSTLGAALSFLVSRYLARDFVNQKFGQKQNFAAVDQAVSEQGWKIVGLLRLSPVFPYNALNYILGLTGIRFTHYIVASWAGMLPGTLLYVYLGYLGKQGLESASGEGSTDLLRWIYLGLGLLATLGVTVYVTRLASKAIKNKTPLEETQ
ncbi:TVP38/TMEM64 family protein [Kiritimatiellaeota bacterium B1221]|nr:TVP38/TMEM64 family protein [Kiritimatiellaeota bacterium B1221]